MSKNQVAAAETTTETAAVIKPKLNFKKTKLITIPLLKLELDVPVYVKLTGEYFVGKEVKGVGEKAKMEPAVLCHCINLETGEQQQIILNSVIKANLDEAYANHGYVNKSFEFIKHDKREGKRYNDFSLAEIELTV